MIKATELTFSYISRFCDFENDLVLTNHFHSDWEADILIVDKQGYSHEIEIKLSKADFKNDFRKRNLNRNTNEKFLKHDKISCGDYPCNSFSFLLPQGMIELEEIPDYCGIIEFYHNPDSWQTTFDIIRQPKQIHTTPFWDLTDKDCFMRAMARNLLYRKLELKSQREEIILSGFYDRKK